MLTVAMAAGFHPFPFRTGSLSPPAPMVLPQGGRVGRRRSSFPISSEVGIFFYLCTSNSFTMRVNYLFIKICLIIAVVFSVNDSFSQVFKLDSLYFPFPDSLRQKALFVYKVNPETMAPVFYEYDTTLNGIQSVMPYQRYSVGTISTGNNGGATMPIDYFYRSGAEDFLFLKNFIPYINSPTGLPIINSQKRFTRLGYSTNRKKIGEQILELTHNQNIVPGWSVGLKYNGHSAAGFYQNEYTRDNSFNIYSSFYGPRLKSYISFALHRIKVKENGGVTKESDVVNNLIDAENIPVNLLKAKNEISGIQLFASNSYGIVSGAKKGLGGEPYLELRHTLKYDKFSRVFVDAPIVGGDQYFKHFYVSKTVTNDSVYYRNLSNELTLSGNFLGGVGRAFKLYIKAGIDLERYYYWKPEFFLSASTNKDYTNLYSGAGLFTRVKGIDLSVYTKSYISGRRSGDLLFAGTGNFVFSILGFPVAQTASLSVDSKTADFFSTHYFSNNIKWDNSFNRINELRASYNLALPKLRSSVEARFVSTDGYVFFNSDTIPEQASGQVTVASLFFRNHLKFGIVNFIHNVVVQTTSDENIIPLPYVALKGSYFVEFTLIKNVLTTQIGGDIFFNTKYYAEAYNPAIAQFYLQKNRKIGEYPNVSAFVNLQWKRAQIFLKYDHLSQNWFERDYFSAYSYPIGERSFKFGVYWNFYD